MLMQSSRCLLPCRVPMWMLCVASLFVVGVARADEPLHARIDAAIAKRATGPIAGPADDAEFIRRIYLDLAGRIPTAEEARKFFADASPEKRQQVIDQLLAGPDYPQRMQAAFNVMFMERQGEHPDWLKFLQTSFAANKPWDQMAREILAPNPDDENTRGSAFFFTKRLEHYGQNAIDMPGMTRDVGRLFLGMDLQCAQCHNHLFVDDYKQADFQGMFAFVGNTFIRGDLKFPAIGETPLTKKVEFMSVFVKEKTETGPRLPGTAEVEIPVFAKGEEFLTPPDKTTKAPGVPKFSPLKLLSEQMTRPEFAPATKNIANRLWFLMLGRGQVHPLDLHHSKNPASHPEILDMLSQEFVAHKFDIKWVLRELALTQTYQRSSRLPDGVDSLPPESFFVAIEKPLSAEQLFAGMLQATGERDRLAALPLPAGADAEKEKAAAQAKQTELQQRFVKAFANPPKEPEVEFSPSVKAALFILNDSVVLSWLNPQPGNLVDRLGKLADNNQLAEELYVNVLTRLPTDEEKTEVATFLTQHANERPKAIGELVWALLASTEFCVNH